jgi:hypothetical protein
MSMEIEIAAYGWQDPEWDPFYPSDLPAEWRLDYYANEFHAVVVPYHEWLPLDDEALLGWAQQVRADFRFYWELPVTAKQARARLQGLGENTEFSAHWGGVVDLEAAVPRAQNLCSEERLLLLHLEQNLALRPLRQAMEVVMGQGGARLLVVVAANALGSLRPARDLALLLGGG